MTDPDQHRAGEPTIQEIAALTARLRALSNADADSAEREAFLADKHALLARIPTDHPPQQQDTTQHAERSARGTGQIQEDDMSSNDERAADSTPERATDNSAEVGFVPRFGAEPSAYRYETMGRDEAVERIAAVGFDRADAAAMVDEYVVEATTTHGEPTGGLVIDPYDLADIAARYEWVDHYRGETITTARDRAAQQAAFATQLAATHQDPDRVQWATRNAALWAGRAARDPHQPMPNRAAADGDAGVEALSPDRLEAARLAGALLSQAKHTTDPAQQAALTEQASRAARYAHDPTRTQDSGPWRAVDGAGQVVATFDPADAYSAAEITAIAEAHARRDHAEVDRLQEGRPRLVPTFAESVDEPAGEAVDDAWRRMAAMGYELPDDAELGLTAEQEEIAAFGPPLTAAERAEHERAVAERVADWEAGREAGRDLEVGTRRFERVGTGSDPTVVAVVYEGEGRWRRDDSPEGIEAAHRRSAEREQQRAAALADPAFAAAQREYDQDAVAWQHQQDAQGALWLDGDGDGPVAMLDPADDLADDPVMGAEDIAREAHVADVSWAVAARDAAIERGDTTAAVQFVQQARAALDAADQAGIGRAQLAYELDYPGGAAELDGEHIDLSIDSEPISAAELARRYAEFDALCERDPAIGDPAEVAIDVDEYDDWPDTDGGRDESDEPRERNGAQLAEYWEQAMADPLRRAAIAAALDQSGQAYVEPAHSDDPDPWAHPGSTHTPDPADDRFVDDRAAGADETSVRVVGTSEAQGRTVPVGHAEIADSAAATYVGSSRAVEPGADEIERRAQLARWHDDDQASAATEHADDGPVLTDATRGSEEE